MGHQDPSTFRVPCFSTNIPLAPYQKETSSGQLREVENDQLVWRFPRKSVPESVCSQITATRLGYRITCPTVTPGKLQRVAFPIIVIVIVVVITVVVLPSLTTDETLAHPFFDSNLRHPGQEESLFCPFFR